ncbi:MAG TPA: hypothetical protein VNZ24_14325 [Vicinamibacterales bacterium]|nr:hypothetical protein [Vicinamibacterales bacterium]
MTDRHRVVIRAALGIVLLAVITHTRADPDLWGHVRFGRDIVSEATIPRLDQYAFTSDREWINHEWLAESTMYIAFGLGRGPGLVVLKMLVVLGMLALMWNGLSRQKVDSATRDLLIALTVFGTFPQLNHVRPQIFSVVAFASLIWILVCTGPARRVLLIPLLFAAWVNFHGGWIVGGGVLALWAVLTLVRGRGEGVLLFAVGAMALVGTLANPYGWRMWQFLMTTVGFGRVEITDWQPLYRLGAGYVALWVVLSLAAIVGIMHAWRARTWELRRLAVVAMLAVASFQVSRLEAFFAIAIALLLGPDIAAALSAWRKPSAAPQAPRTGFATAFAIAIVVALIVGGAVASASNLTCVRMAADQPEPEVVAMVRERELQGRLVVWFDWGEYAIWHFAPQLLVSIDGRRETVYSDQVMQKHLNFYYVPSSRDAFLVETRPDYIWLPANLPVVSNLLADGWMPMFRGPRSIWLSRDPSDVVPSASSPAESGRRCFPGP